MECAQCGAWFTVPRGTSSVQCAHCHGVTRVERHGATGFVRGVFPNIGWGGRTRPQPPAAAPRLSVYPPVHGNKRALLVGINYIGKKNALSGPINDVKCMSFLLNLKYGFPNDCILILTDEERDKHRKPTKSNILLAMRWLVHGCSSGDSLVFHFSGHGWHVKDQDGDELDGQDEAICALDKDILDDEINETIVRPLVQGVKLHAIIDACHSGTVLDLPNLCDIQKYFKNGKPQWKNHSPPNGAWKNTSGGQAILISGCMDDESSNDRYGEVDSMAMGALTYSFVVAAWFAHRPPTYGQLLATIKAIIADVNGDSRINSKLPAPICALVRKVVNFTDVQMPLLSSSEKFDINRKTFLL